MRQDKIAELIRLFREKATIKGLIALAVILTVLPTLVYMAIQGSEMALEVLKTILLIVIGFYFGREGLKGSKGV